MHMSKNYDKHLWKKWNGSHLRDVLLLDRAEGSGNKNVRWEKDDDWQGGMAFGPRRSKQEARTYTPCSTWWEI